MELTSGKAHGGPVIRSQLLTNDVLLTAKWLPLKYFLFLPEQVFLLWKRQSLRVQRPSEWLASQLPFPYSFCTKPHSGMSITLNWKKKYIKYSRSKGEALSFFLHLRKVKAYVWSQQTSPKEDRSLPYFRFYGSIGKIKILWGYVHNKRKTDFHNVSPKHLKM